jgi:MFS family permease
MASDASSAPESLENKGGTYLFVACFIALVATSFAFIIRVVLMDQWQIAFDLSETQKGEIFGAGLWPFGLSIVLFSLVIDRIGYGKSMIFAFLCHAASAVLLMTASAQAGYWMLYTGSILNGLAAGTVEAVINPAVASMYPKRKTTMLTILHAGWPGGFVLAGISLLLIGNALPWQVKVGIILVPTLIYGLMLLRAKFPVSERVSAGVPYRDMLREAGAIGWLIVVYLVCMEINRVMGLGNLVDTTFFDLPSMPMLIVMGVLIVGYFAYTRAAGAPMYIFLLLVMILLAITELGTDTWIKDLMKPAMSKVGLNAGWVLVYTATIMMLLRFCIAPIERLLKPLGVLLASALFAAAGLYMLAQAEGAMILVWATIYGTGQCFFWPVTLGLVSERFPRGGALTLNAIAGVGMLGVGILGSQLLGFWQDTRIDEQLQPDTAMYARLMDKTQKESIFGVYKSLSGRSVNEVEDKARLYEARKAIAEKAGAEAEKALAESKLYATLARNAFDHLKPAKPEDDPAWGKAKETDDHATRLAYLKAKGFVLDEAGYQEIAKVKKALDTVRADAKRGAMQNVAILPLIMAACYLGLIIYFSSKGGYKVVDLAADGHVAGEHKVSTNEAVADAEATPNE